MSKWNHLNILALVGALPLTPLLHARPCVGNGDVVGGYGFSGSRSPIFAPLSIDPPGTNLIARSATPIGLLAGGAANAQAFSAVGRVYFDGNGAIWATPTATTPSQQVGAYSINVDCTISATITDVFSPVQEFFFAPAQASVSFLGVVVQSGSEISLTQINGPGGTSLTLRKAKQNSGCTDENLNGSFGLAATGLSYTLDPENEGLLTTPFNLAGRIAGDGAGKFTLDALSEQSPVKNRQFTGTYSVNGDCTGVATLVDSSNKIRKISLVLVNLGVGSSGTSGILFAFTDSTIGSGEGSLQ